jgi:hypothetical protein
MLTDDDLNYSMHDFSRDVAFTLDEMRKRIRQLETRIVQLETREPTTTAKFKLVQNDGA